MTRFHGAIGYGDTIEDPPGSGVWVDDIVEHSYFGDLVRSTGKLEPGENLNDNISVQNSISVVADGYIEKNFLKIKYVVWNDEYWKISSVQLTPPRLILSIGDVYNGPKAGG